MACSDNVIKSLIIIVKVILYSFHPFIAIFSAHISVLVRLVNYVCNLLKMTKVHSVHDKVLPMPFCKSFSAHKLMLNDEKS